MMFGDQTPVGVSPTLSATPIGESASPVTPWTLRQKALEEKNKRIRELQGRLEVEQLERLDLEEELRLLNEKLTYQDKKFRETKSEILNLRAVRDDLLTQQQEVGEGHQCSNMRYLHLQEIKDLEKFANKLQAEVEQLTEEKELLATKSHEMTTKSAQWEHKSNQLQYKVEELEFNLLEREQDMVTLKQALKDYKIDLSELQQLVEEKQKACPTPDSPWWTKGENLGSAVTDLKLKEAEDALACLRHQNESLSADKCSLMDQLRQANLRLDEVEQEVIEAHQGTEEARIQLVAADAVALEAQHSVECMKKKAEEKLDEMRKKIDQLSKDKEAAEEKMRLSEEAKEKLRADLSKVVANHSAAESKATAILEEQMSLLGKIKSKEAELAKVASELKDTTEANNNLKEQLEEANGKAAVLEESGKEAKKEITLFKETNKDQAKLVLELSKTIAMLEGVQERSAKQLQEACRELENSRTRLHANEKESKLAITEQAKLESSLLSAEASLRKVETAREIEAKRAEEAESNLSAALERIQMFESEKVTLKAKQEAVEKAMDAARVDIASKEIQILRLQEKLAQLKEERVSSQEASNRWEAAVKQAQDGQQEAKRLLEKETTHRAELENERQLLIVKLTRTIEDCQLAAQQAQKAKHEALQEVEGAQSKVAEVTQVLATLQSAVAADKALLIEEKVQILSEKHQLTGELQNAQESYGALQKECSGLHSALLDSKNEAKSLQAESARLQGEFKRLRNIQEDLERDKARLEEDKRELNISLDVFRNDAERSQGKLDSLAGQKRALESHVEDAERERILLVEEIRRLEKELEDRCARLYMATDALRTAQIESSHLQNDLAKANHDIKIAKDEASILQHECANLLMQMEKDRQNLKEVQELLAKAESERDSLDTKLTDASSEKNGLELRITEMEDELCRYYAQQSSQIEMSHAETVLRQATIQDLACVNVNAVELNESMKNNDSGIQALQELLQSGSATKDRIEALQEKANQQTSVLERDLVSLVQDVATARKHVIEAGGSVGGEGQVEKCASWFQMALADIVDESNPVIGKEVERLRTELVAYASQHSRIREECLQTERELMEADAALVRMQKDGYIMEQCISTLVNVVKLVRISFPQSGTAEINQEDKLMLNGAAGELCPSESELTLEVIQRECEESVEALHAIRAFHKEMLEKASELEHAPEPEEMSSKTSVDKSIQVECDVESVSSIAENILSERCSCTLTQDHSINPSCHVEPEYNPVKETISNLVKAQEDLQTQLKVVQSQSFSLERNLEERLKARVELESRLEELMNEERALEERVKDVESNSGALRDRLELLGVKEKLLEMKSATAHQKVAVFTEEQLLSSASSFIKKENSSASSETVLEVLEAVSEVFIKPRPSLPTSEKPSISIVEVESVSQDAQVAEEIAVLRASLACKEAQLAHLRSTLTEASGRALRLEQERQQIVAEQQRLVREEYDGKLARLKQRMMEAYAEEKAAAESRVKGLREACEQYADQVKRYGQELEERKRQLDEMTALCQSESSARAEMRNHLRDMAAEKRSLECQLQVSVERLKEFREAASQNEGNKENAPPLALKKSSSHHKVSMQIIPMAQGSSYHSHVVPSGTGNLFNCEDEDGEVFDNTYLDDLKSGSGMIPADVTATSGTADTIGSGPWGRLSELQRRNTLYPPHMRSCYPAETQFHTPSKFRDDDLKAGKASVGILGNNNSANVEEVLPSRGQDGSSHTLLDLHNATTLSQTDRRKWKEMMQTTYKRPGPPTPGKYGTEEAATPVAKVSSRRLADPGSASSNASNSSNTSKKLTPGGRLRNFLRRSSRYKPQEQIVKLGRIREGEGRSKFYYTQEGKK